eukprot:SAG31_NODE_473_length_15222_cov_4.788005_3_plen_93_part_00
MYLVQLYTEGTYMYSCTCTSKHPTARLHPAAAAAPARGRAWPWPPWAMGLANLYMYIAVLHFKKYYPSMLVNLHVVSPDESLGMGNNSLTKI